MLKLNDNSIFTGQIKQVLNTFNLPVCSIGDSFPANNKLFIKGRGVYCWKLNIDTNVLEQKYLGPYNEGDKYLNLTTTLKINNLLYDRETHRYLGRYLRFLRDYKNIDLMSMYNCFDGELLSDLTMTINNVVFSSIASDKVVYKIPITKQKYSIYLHSFTNIETCVLVDSKILSDKEKIVELAEKTFRRKKINGIIDYDVFDSLSTDLSTFVNENLDKLYLLIKVAKDLSSSLVILEGTNFSIRNIQNKKVITYYPCIPTNTTQFNLTDSEGYVLADYNNTILNVVSESISKSDTLAQSKFEIYPQLFSNENATKNYLLADRLVEYLTENAVTSLNPSYEIRRYQWALKTKYHLIVPSGIWDDSALYATRDIICNNNLQDTFDCVGYLDKDVEVILKEDLDNVNL